VVRLLHGATGCMHEILRSLRPLTAPICPNRAVEDRGLLQRREAILGALRGGHLLLVRGPACMHARHTQRGACMHGGLAAPLTLPRSCSCACVHTWLACRRLLVFPRGNAGNAAHLAAYLDAPDASSIPQHMFPTAKFTLTLVNQKDPSKSFSKGEQPPTRGA
jgi:hypothetical protein